MDRVKAEEIIRENVTVTPQKVTVAKAFLARNVIGDRPEALLDALLRHLSATLPTGDIVLNSQTDPTPALKQLAESISWWLAGAEAINALIHCGVLHISGGEWWEQEPRAMWLAGNPAGSYNRGGFSLGEFKVALPYRLRRSWVETSGVFLSDADLYLSDLAIPNLDADVGDALSEAVRCFRQELYLACVVMLGKAAEGAWIEVAIAMGNGFGDSKLASEGADPLIGFARKIQKVLDWSTTHKKEIEQRCSVRLNEIEAAALWADMVRDSRNAVHHKTRSATANTYEKVATLLMGAVSPLRTLYKLISSCR
jgi:hypothetical protein